MPPIPPHAENHLLSRIGWLRAAVLGANDGIVSTASLIVGVASASAAPREIFLAGTAGLVAGAMSMAAGEYVSVHSQSDTERADREREQRELAEQPEAEEQELAAIYEARGLQPALAAEVARQLTARDALGAHLRDELGLTEMSTARPIQAAFASAASFSIGAALPLVTVLLTPHTAVLYAVPVASLAFLALLGAVGAKAGGAGSLRAAGRVAFWGTLAMVTTAGIGGLFGIRAG